jgi:hypothetical protein
VRLLPKDVTQGLREQLDTAADVQAAAVRACRSVETACHVIIGCAVLVSVLVAFAALSRIGGPARG